MKNFKNLIIIMILFFGIGNVLAFDNTIKVYDYAQVLSEKEEKKLKTQVNDYINKYNLDMVIVTVKYYEQTDVNQYINLFYNQNNFGVGINKDGIIVALDFKKNNTIGIKTFGKAINLYSTSEIQGILNKVNEEEDYYDKLSSFVKYSDKYVNQDDNSYTIDNSTSTSINWILIILPSLIILTIVIIIGLLKNKYIKKDEFVSYYIKRDSIVINKKEDKFITTNTKKRRINNK